MIFYFVAVAVGGCPTAEIPAALTKAGVEYRNCFFGNARAAETAMREAAKEAGCEQTGNPPACTCPSPVPQNEGKVDCTNWAVNFVRFYVYDYEARDESKFVDSLTRLVRLFCSTHVGQIIPIADQGTIKPDSLLPACQRFQPAAVADIAAFTAYITFMVVSIAYVLFENYEIPSIMYEKKMT